MAKEAGWVVLGHATVVSGSLALVRVLTDYLDPEQYGELALGLTAAGFVNQLIMGGVTNGISRYYSIAVEKGELSSYIRATWRMLRWASYVTLSIGIVITVGLIELGNTKWLGLVFAVLCFSILAGYNGALNSIQFAARHRVLVAVHSGLAAWLKIAFAIGVMSWLGSTSAAAAAGYAVSMLLVTASQVVWLRRLSRTSECETGLVAHGGATASRAWESRMWLFSQPFIFWGAFTWAQQASDRWALSTFSSVWDVGLYLVVYQLGYVPIGQVTGLVFAFLAPILFQRSGGATDHGRNVGVHRLVWRLTWLCLFVTLLSSSAALFLHEWLFRILVAPAYRSASALLPWLVLAGGVFAAGQMLSIKLVSDLNTKGQMAPKIGTALLGIVLNVVGARFFGVVGIVAAHLAFSVAFFTWMAWIARRPPSIMALGREREDVAPCAF